MDRGLYQKFVFIHQEQMSNREAHGTCVFLFWHRKFLLGFENMLRSLGDRYQCLTLPYWDYVQNYATMVNTPQAQRCRSIQACSPVTGGLGGSTQGAFSRASFFGVNYPNNRCVNQRPVNRMCPTVGSSSCPYCTPRGNWAATAMIPDMAIANIRRRVFGSATIRAVTADIESSPHNSIHAALGGPMANPMVSAMDPIFFMHHNTIDLLHTIYYRCRVESLNLSDAQQQNDARSFQGCTTNNGETVGPRSSLRMRLADSGRPIDVANDPLVGSFFRDLPNQYYRLTDVRQLGYAFELRGLLGNLYSRCSSAAEIAGDSIDNVVQPVVRAESKNELAFEDAVLAQAERQGLSLDDAYEELHKMSLVLHDKMLPGSIEDFTPDFKAAWQLNCTAKSFALFQDIRSGSAPIRIDKWQDLLQQYFDCTWDA